MGLSIDFIEDVIWREKKRILRWSLIILFVGIAIAIGLGIYFSIPISKLVEATREISQGKFKQKVKIRRRDELGNLARAFNHMSEELWVKSLMKKSFGKYVGHEILELILKSPESKWLEGQKNEATVIFADIRGFTSYSERTMPDKVITDLNEFFEIATNIILNHNGYVDKFIGDAVLGVFGVPVYHGDHEETAVRACMEMQKTFKEKVQEKKKKNKESNQLLISVGISINSGLVVSGNIGSQEKMEYTVIGDAVNLASRINGFAGAGEVIIGEAIFEKLADRIDTIAMPPAVIKGKSELVRTYKVLRFYEK